MIRRAFAGAWAFTVGLPGRLSDWLTGTELRGHGAVDVARSGDIPLPWCLTCNEPAPCDKLTAMWLKGTGR